MPSQAFSSSLKPECACSLSPPPLPQLTPISAIQALRSSLALMAPPPGLAAPGGHGAWSGQQQQMQCILGRLEARFRWAPCMRIVKAWQHSASRIELTSAAAAPACCREQRDKAAREAEERHQLEQQVGARLQGAQASDGLQAPQHWVCLLLSTAVHSAAPLLLPPSPPTDVCAAAGGAGAAERDGGGRKFEAGAAGGAAGDSGAAAPRCGVAGGRGVVFRALGRGERDGMRCLAGEGMQA